LTPEDKLKHAKSLANSEPDEAMRICCDVMNDHMDSHYGQMALFMSGYIMMGAERYGLAYHIYERCAQLNPNVSEVWSNMGMCMEDYDPYKAMRLFQKAYQMKPDNASAYANEALIHLQTGSPQQCIDLCDKAMEIDPDLRAAIHNKGLAQVMLRQWEEGWTNYYDTLGVKHRERRDYGLPEWNGEYGTVVVYGEQGVGDEIMFASCLPDIMKATNVVLDCDSRLQGLFARSFDCSVYGTRYHKETPLMDNENPDYQLAIGQLPHFYRNTDNDFPGDPYLIPDPDLVVQWQALFDTFKGRKIGLAWRGGSRVTGASRRSLELEDLEPILNDRDTFISLEYKPVDKFLLDKYGIKSYPRATGKGGDIDDLAALVSQLDLVVTACTTVVYVAGALGVPCVVLVPDKPGYRYHITGDDFPWYKSINLVRQKGSWRETVEAARKLIND
jgi:tetratricopeptide (TPR) repeat protein